MTILGAMVLVPAGPSVLSNLRRGRQPRGRGRRQRHGAHLRFRGRGCLPAEKEETMVEPLDDEPEETLRRYIPSHFSTAVKKQARGLFPKDEIEGVGTGWASVDRIYKPVKGELTVATGTPGSGKSEFLLALATNCARSHGWRIGLCTMEAKKEDVLFQLVEKSCRSHIENISQRQCKQVYKTLIKQFEVIACDFEQPSIDDLLMRAQYVCDGGEALDALLIDPYNYISQAILGSEVDFASDLLSKLKHFAALNNCHIWLVAHPCKPGSWASRGEQSESGEARRLVPSLYDISGSAHFFNKCDMGLIVDRDPECGRMTLHVDKVRNRDAGQVGVAELWFDRRTRCYSDAPRALERAWNMEPEDGDGELMQTDSGFLS